MASKTIKPASNKLLNAGYSIMYNATGYTLLLDGRKITEYRNMGLPRNGRQALRNVELFRLIVLGIAEIELNNLLEKTE